MKAAAALILVLAAGCAGRGVPRRVRPAASPPPLPPVPALVAAARAEAVAPTPTTVTLAWDYPADMAGVVKFKIYRGTASGTYGQAYETAGLTNALSVSYFAAPGEVDYFVAVSVDAGGMESPPSNEVRWPPIPTVTLSWDAPWGAVEESADLRRWAEVTNGTPPVTLPRGQGPALYRVRSDRPVSVRVRTDW